MNESEPSLKNLSQLISLLTLQTQAISKLADSVMALAMVLDPESESEEVSGPAYLDTPRKLSNPPEIDL